MWETGLPKGHPPGKGVSATSGRHLLSEGILGGSAARRHFLPQPDAGFPFSQPVPATSCPWEDRL